MKPVEIIGVRVEAPGNQPVLLIKEQDGPRLLPIWVGASEAAAIAYAQQGVEPPRPLTHDLFVATLEALDQPLESVSITEMRDSVFYAELHFANGIVVSARPSDAIALALRADVPVNGDESLFDSVGITASTGDDDVELEAFKEFLDHVSPEDFAIPDEQSDDPPTTT